MLATIGTLSGHSNQADQLVKNLQQRETELEKKLSRVSKPPDRFL